MKKHTVRIEVIVTESAFIEIEVEASNRDEAIKKAINVYDEGTGSINEYAGERLSVTIDEDTQKDWQVETA